MGGKPFQSKLLPYCGEIKKYRMQGISYQEISEILKQSFGVHVDPSTIFSFVKRRSKKRKKVITMLEESGDKSSNTPFFKKDSTQKLKKESNNKTDKADNDDFVFDFNPDEPIY